MSNGIDLVYINRFKSLINKNFFNKIFTENELKYINFRNNDLGTIAGIYASKEAFLKAIKKGINDYSLKDIEINHNNSVPYITLYNELIEYNNKNISLSISHDENYAIASVLIS